jgi:hypothetical protein
MNPNTFNIALERAANFIILYFTKTNLIGIMSTTALTSGQDQCDLAHLFFILEFFLSLHRGKFFQRQVQPGWATSFKFNNTYIMLKIGRAKPGWLVIIVFSSPELISIFAHLDHEYDFKIVSARMKASQWAFFS